MASAAVDPELLKVLLIQTSHQPHVYCEVQTGNVLDFQQHGATCYRAFLKQLVGATKTLFGLVLVDEHDLSCSTDSRHVMCNSSASVQTCQSLGWEIFYQYLAHTAGDKLSISSQHSSDIKKSLKVQVLYLCETFKPPPLKRPCLRHCSFFYLSIKLHSNNSGVSDSLVAEAHHLTHCSSPVN